MCLCVCVCAWSFRYFYHFSTHSWAQQRERAIGRESSGRRFAYLMACSGSDSDCGCCACCDCCLSLFLGLACALLLLFFFALCCCPHICESLSLTLSSVLFDVVVVNCSSLLSCTLHNAPLITAEWEKERERAQLLLVFVNGFLFVYMRV